MFEGNPIARSPAVKVMVWIDCAVLIFAGFAGFIGNIFNFLNFVYPVLGIYIILFGLICSAVELGIGFVTSRFAFLTDWIGASFFFIFVGTIAISFFSNSLIVFLCGVYSCAVGFASIIDHFVCKSDTVPATIRPR